MLHCSTTHWIVHHHHHEWCSWWLCEWAPHTSMHTRQLCYIICCSIVYNQLLVGLMMMMMMRATLAGKVQCIQRSWVTCTHMHAVLWMQIRNNWPRPTRVVLRPHRNMYIRTIIWKRRAMWKMALFIVWPSYSYFFNEWNMHSAILRTYCSSVCDAIFKWSEMILLLLLNLNRLVRHSSINIGIPL